MILGYSDLELMIKLTTVLMWKFGFSKEDNKGQITRVKGLESWSFKR